MTRAKWERHGCSKHKYFRRWGSIIQRCYNKENTHYDNYGGRGVTVAKVWSPFNIDGPANFIKWMEMEVAVFHHKHPTRINDRIEVGRINVNKNFSPLNCEIRFLGHSTHNRRTSVLTVEKVTAIRQYKKQNKEASLSEIGKKFDQSPTNISRCLRGVTWSCVDATEPPIMKPTF